MAKVMATLLLVGVCLTGYRWLNQAWMLPNLRATAQAEAAVEVAAVEVAAPLHSNAAPTVAPIFLAHTSSTANAAALKPTATITLQTEPRPHTAGTPSTEPGYREMVVYDEQLNGSWSVAQSDQTTVNLAATDVSFQALDPAQQYSSGATAIGVTPQADYGSIFFTVRPESGATYQRQAVLGVSLWLNSGNNGIGPADLAIAVVGSNAVPYWTADDHSVFRDQKGAFSETRLYFLQVNRTVPPHTWLNLIVWLHDLQYDPAYQYVTGFYLKNDAGFRSTYYLDQVALLMAP